MKLVDALRTPSYRRSVLIRRCLSLLFVGTAAVSVVSSRAAEPLVVSFARDVSAGSVVGAADLELRRVPASSVPDNAVTAVEGANGKVLAAAASAGEILTTTRLVGAELADDLTQGETSGEPFTMVPVALAEPDIIPMLYHGATVSVITATGDAARPSTIATGGRVVLAGGAEKKNDATVLLLLRESQAAAVAAASLTSPLTVVLGRPGV
ncbi:hypothetical protein CAPI_07490 [Corynebacterium capitovis DSM 44611]|uniref:SAF domain-containing protein n=1 Tax=Corynebacterium capitovis TaxID=131081 RepID=UPI00035FBF63|nr:SAF domain-containing protein [Corynebacterium capitovis]WKD58035.1 hypothetical protein CAPI_07490 [Corynebacterium capitovis DSM 44611]